MKNIKNAWRTSLYVVQIRFQETFEIQKCIFERNTNLNYLRNTGNLKWRNTRIAQSRFSGHREQTLSTCVLKRLDQFMHTLDSKFRYMTTITPPKLPPSSCITPVRDSERGGLCSHQGGHVLHLLQPRHQHQQDDGKS